jgi:hypothetical protein
MTQDKSESHWEKFTDSLYKTMQENQHWKTGQKFNFKRWEKGGGGKYPFVLQNDNIVNKFQEMYINLDRFRKEKEIPIGGMRERWTTDADINKEVSKLKKQHDHKKAAKIETAGSQEKKLKDKILHLLRDAMNEPTLSVAADGKISVTFYHSDHSDDIAQKILETIKKSGGFKLEPLTVFKHLQEKYPDSFFNHFKSKTFTGYSLDEISEEMMSASISDPQNTDYDYYHYENFAKIKEEIEDNLEVTKISELDLTSEEDTFRKLLALQSIHHLKVVQDKYAEKDAQGKNALWAKNILDGVFAKLQMSNEDFESILDDQGVKDAITKAYERIATIDTQELVDERLEAVIAKANETFTPQQTLETDPDYPSQVHSGDEEFNLSSDSDSDFEAHFENAENNQEVDESREQVQQRDIPVLKVREVESEPSSGQEVGLPALLTLIKNSIDRALVRLFAGINNRQHFPEQLDVCTQEGSNFESEEVIENVKTQVEKINEDDWAEVVKAGEERSAELDREDINKLCASIEKNTDLSFLKKIAAVQSNSELDEIILDEDEEVSYLWDKDAYREVAVAAKERVSELQPRIPADVQKKRWVFEENRNAGGDADNEEPENKMTP